MVMNPYIKLDKTYGAQNYSPLPVVLVRGEGVWVWDDQGKKYLDMMSGYSSISHGHAHPELVETLHQQAQKLAMCSRAFYTDKAPELMEKLCKLLNYDKVLLMNSGAEAVETAIKAMRRWGYFQKKIPDSKAEIITFSNNFHGRTTTISSFSSSYETKRGFKPFTPGFKLAEYGCLESFKLAITNNTCGVLLEPIQGEAGIIVPPKGWLRQVHHLCKEHNIMLVCDEIQSGLGRTGKWLASEHEGVQPDGVTLAKSLGGGLIPISAFVGCKELLDVFTPGSHGSTFGANPLACAVAIKSLEVMKRDNYLQQSSTLGKYLKDQLKTLTSPLIKEIRGVGLWVGVDVDMDKTSGKQISLSLMQQGVLAKETRASTIRFAPPLIITQDQIDYTISVLKKIL